MKHQKLFGLLALCGALLIARAASAQAVEVEKTIKPYTPAEKVSGT